MGKVIRYVLDEFPKVTFLLVIGAFILFPMYMMISISFMTPAQLERFPWFPRELPVPEELEAPRAGMLEIEPATLEIQAVGAAARKITVPVDRRFYLDLPGVDGSQMSWRVAPGSDGAASTVAWYRAADVYAVESAPDGYLVRGQPFAAPEGFTSLLPGLHRRSLALGELRIVDAGLVHAQAALRSADLAPRATDEVSRRERQRDAVVRFLQAERCLDLASRAMRRAEEHGREAAQRMVPVGDDLAAAAKKLERLRLLIRRTSDRIRDYYTQHEAESRAAAETIVEQVAAGEAFKVDQGEAVAVLLCDRPATVTRVPGRATVRTEWQYEARRRRPLTIRPLIDAETVSRTPPPAGAPLAEMVAADAMTLRAVGGAWLMPDGTPLAGYLPPGFELLPGMGPPTDGQARAVAAGEPVARATMPKVVAELGDNSLVVGLAVVRADGSWHIPPGNGRWTYSTYVDRAVPFGVRLAEGVQLGSPSAAGRRPILADPGDVIAQYYVNRRRVVKAARVHPDRRRLQWVTAAEGAVVSVPPGFDDAQPPLPRREAGDVWTGGTVLGELRMPSIGVAIEDDTLIVRMSGSEWSEGQWEYPLDEYEPLEIVKADVPSMEGDGPWTVQDALGPDEEVTDRLAEAARRVVELEGCLDDAHWTGDAAEAARVEALLVDARRALASARKAAVPPDAMFEVRARRRATLDYVNQQWTLGGRPLRMWYEEDALSRVQNALQDAAKQLRAVEAAHADDAAARSALDAARRDYDQAVAWLERVLAAEGFLPLSGEGEILSAGERRVVVEAGDVLARLRAEPSHEAEANWAVQTRASMDGDRLTVSFAHALALPVRANVVATDAEGRLKTRVGDGLSMKDRLVARYFTPRRFDVDNYREAWQYVKDYLLNTVIVAVSSMGLGIFLASLSAFVFARFHFPGKAVFYGMIIILLMIPGVLNLIPLYVTVKWFGLLNQPLNLLGRINAILVLVLPAVAGGQVMNVYVMRNNLETLAKDLFDAARIDGASNWQTYWHIAVPLSKPIMGTLAIFALLSQWNNFIWPWVVIREQKFMTVTAGLALLEGQNLSDYGLQMAGAFTASIPLIILFFFMMNLFIRGMQSGAIKA